MPYKHTQIGYVIIVCMAVGSVIAYFNHALPVFWIMATAGIFFGTLTVSIGSESVEISFGPGLIRKRFSLADIETCQAMKQRCWSWGIHGWPGRGWLYNVSGFHCVELKMKNGRKYYIGTDEPEVLEKAIHEAMHLSLYRSIKMSE